jgi:hypothetical protein
MYHRVYIAFTDMCVTQNQGPLNLGVLRASDKQLTQQRRKKQHSKHIVTCMRFPWFNNVSSATTMEQYNTCVSLVTQTILGD